VGTEKVGEGSARYPITGDSDFGNLLRFPLTAHFGIVVLQFARVMRACELARQVATTLSALEDVTIKSVV
jgi:hypothetical protein